MCKKKYIILLLILLFALNCAPTKHYTRNSINNNSSNSPDDISFSWHEDEQDHGNFTSNVDSINKNDNGYKSKKNNYSKRLETFNNIAHNNNEKSVEQNSKRNSTRSKQKYSLTEQAKKIKNISNPKTKEHLHFTIYRVEKGDNIIKISKKFCISVNELKNINNIKSKKLKIGMNLKIPDKNKKNNFDTKYISHNGNQKNPNFCWPLKDVYSTERDGLDGVKPIGIIITGKPGTNVLSSADGVVTKVGHMRGFGNYIILTHVNKYLTIYSNLKEIKVNEGENIKKGKSIARLEGNKLHFQIGYSGRPADPLIYLSKKG